MADLQTLNNELFELQKERNLLVARKQNAELSSITAEKLVNRYTSQLKDLKGEMMGGLLGVVQKIFIALMPTSKINVLENQIARCEYDYLSSEIAVRRLSQQINLKDAAIQNKQIDIQQEKERQATQPTPTQATQPTPTQATQPTPMQATQPTPTQATQPTPTHEAQPTPTQEAQSTQEAEAEEQTQEEAVEESVEEAEEAVEESVEEAEETVEETVEEAEETVEEAEEAVEESEEEVEEVWEEYEEEVEETEETVEEAEEAVEESVEETIEEVEESVEETEQPTAEATQPIPQYADPTKGRAIPSKIPVKNGIINFQEGEAREVLKKYNDKGFVKKNEETQSDGMQNLAGLISKYPGSITTLPESAIKKLGQTQMKVKMADGTEQKMDGFSYLSGVATQTFEAQMAEAKTSGDASKEKEITDMQAKVGSFMVGDDQTMGAMKIAAEARARQNGTKVNTNQSGYSSTM